MVDCIFPPLITKTSGDHAIGTILVLWSFSPQVGESWELDLPFAGDWNANISKNRKINNKNNPQIIVNVPICTNVSRQAQQHIVWHLQSHNQQCRVAPLQWPWVRNCPRSNLPKNYPKHQHINIIVQILYPKVEVQQISPTKLCLNYNTKIMLISKEKLAIV